MQIDWYGRVGMLNAPTTDKRMLTGRGTLREASPVLAKGSVIATDAQHVGRILTLRAFPRFDGKPSPMWARLRFDLAALRWMDRGRTLWPEIDVASNEGWRVVDDLLVMTDPLVIGIHMGESPCWDTVDPVLRAEPLDAILRVT